MINGFKSLEDLLILNSQYYDNLTETQSELIKFH